MIALAGLMFTAIGAWLIVCAVFWAGAIALAAAALVVAVALDGLTALGRAVFGAPAAAPVLRVLSWVATGYVAAVLGGLAIMCALDALGFLH